MTTWNFEKKRRSQKTRDPMQASFFTNASIDDDTHALVREAIQNSLDARNPYSKGPVKVRFALGTLEAGDEAIQRYVSENAWKHFNAADNGLRNPPTVDSDCRYLVFEDFNTTGLIGDETSHEPNPGNAFYYFLRAEGQSGKDEGDRGRHGIGKYVFPYTSGIKIFIAATVRSDDQRCLVAGQSILNSHTVDGQSYTPDGWWGRFDDHDGFQLPIECEKCLTRLSQDFGLVRTSEDTGLSLIMPYVSKDTSADLITRHVIAEYFMPILHGQLIAEVVEGDRIRHINAESLKNSLSNLIPEQTLAEISPFVEMAIASLDDEAITAIDLSVPDSHRLPSWNADLVDKPTAVSIGIALNNSKSLLRVRIPVCVWRVGRDAEWSAFNMFIRKEDDDKRRKPLFVREGITIPEDRVGKVRGYTCMAVIEAGPLATMLGDSENPAHTEWEKNAVKFKGKYKWGPKTIDFVRLGFPKLLGLLAQADEEEDRDVLSDIFFIDLPENDEEVPDSRKQRGDAKTEKG